MSCTISEFMNLCAKAKKIGDEIYFTYHGNRDEGYTEVTVKYLPNLDSITSRADFADLESYIEDVLEDDEMLEDYIHEVKDELDWYDGDDYNTGYDILMCQSDYKDYTPSQSYVEFIETQWYRSPTVTGIVKLPQNRKRGEEHSFSSLVIDDLEIISETPAGCGLETYVSTPQSVLKALRLKLIEIHNTRLMNMIEDE